MKKEITKILGLAICVGLVLISTKVFAVTGTPTTETIRLRKEASTNSDIVVLISQNEKVEIVSEEGEWYKATYVKDNTTYTGYIRKDLIEVKGNNNVEQPSSEQVQTENNNETEQNNTESEQDNTSNTETTNFSKIQKGITLNLNASLDIKLIPSINSSFIGTINEQTIVTVTDIINKWCYIESDKNSGWVLASKLEKKADTTNQNNNTEQTTEKSDNQEQQEENVTEEKKEEIKEEVKEEKKETAKTTTKYVSAETLNLRETTETNAKIITQLPLNTSVTVIEEVDKTWSKVKAKGYTGYVASKYLSDNKVEKTSRSEDEARTTDVQQEKTTTTENENNADNKQNNLANTTKSTSSTNSTTNLNEATSSVAGSSVVSFAKQYLGYKYVSGGSSPQTGFDCSGFTSYVYKNFGKNISRTSSGQASDGTAVSKENLQPGDIVVFNNSSNTAIGHVGIYIGSNTFIHAANASKGVITTSLSDSYYSARYVTARRIL